MESLINVQNLEFSYQGSNQTTIKDFNLEIKSGQSFGLFGPNGAGKTTIISILCGLIKFQIGEVDIFNMPIEKHLKTIQSKIGYVPQSMSLYEELSAKQNLNYFGIMYGLSKDQIVKRSEELLDILGLSHVGSKPIKKYSGGMKRRVNLAIGVLHEPSLLFLDEPTSGVDPIARAEFWDIIYDLSESGVTVIVTTHFMEEADRCNLITLVNAGKLIGVGSPEQLKSTLPVQCYEIKTSALLKTYHGISSLDNVQQVSMFGETVHAITHNNEKELSLKMIRDAGIQINSIEKIRPTLEDVFLNKISNAQEALG